MFFCSAPFIIRFVVVIVANWKIIAQAHGLRIFWPASFFPGLDRSFFRSSDFTSISEACRAIISLQSFILFLQGTYFGIYALVGKLESFCSFARYRCFPSIIRQVINYTCDMFPCSLLVRLLGEDLISPRV